MTQEPIGEERKQRPSMNQALRKYVAEYKEELNLVEEDEDSPVEDDNF